MKWVVRTSSEDHEVDVEQTGDGFEVVLRGQRRLVDLICQDASLASMRLLPDALTITGGSVEVAGRDLFALPEAEMQTVRGQRVAMIFQNAMSALNPVQKVGEQVAETLRLHTSLAGDALRERVLQPPHQ